MASILEEVEEGLNKGHTAFKLKVGRGAIWMDYEQGPARDIQIVLAVRQLCSPDIRIMADANDQLGLVDSKSFWMPGPLPRLARGNLSPKMKEIVANFASG